MKRQVVLRDADVEAHYSLLTKITSLEPMMSLQSNSPG